MVICKGEKMKDLNMLTDLLGKLETQQQVDEEMGWSTVSGVCNNKIGRD